MFAMSILVTGATGFTGSYVVRKLAHQGCKPRCLYRPSSERTFLSDLKLDWIHGDLKDYDSLRIAMKGVTTLVNVASLGFGDAPRIIQAAQDAGVSRAIFVSTTAIFTKLNVKSKKTRLEAEEAIRKSGLAWTILRPTMIYGSARDRNMSRLIQFLISSPVIPIIGNGNFLQQPVYVKDVAGAICTSIASENCVGKAFNISGGNSLTYNQIIDEICSLLGKRVAKLYLNPVPINKMLTIAEHMRIKLPIKAEQIARLNEDKVFEYFDAQQAFGYSPRTFRDGIYCELSTMNLLMR
jgi:nucleoside-diphosphate-sugar epimerase